MTEENDQTREFNLIDEAWIPVIDKEGSPREVSIREALLNAHEYRDLGGELATTRFAIARLLLAIIYRALDTERLENRWEEDPKEIWEELWHAETLPSEPIQQYLDQHAPRFNLTDATKPFMQVPNLETAKGEWRPVDLIMADVDVDRPLFTMRSQIETMTLPEAARWLVHANAYDYSGIKSGVIGDERVKNGKSYPMGVGWCGWLGGVLLTGTDLRETLLLNYLADRPEIDDKDVPIWEQPPLQPRERKTSEIGSVGPIALMTWPQRRFRLKFKDDVVDGVLVSNGDALDYTIQHQTELMSGWRFSQPQSQKAKSVRYMPQTWTPGRSLWRGLGTLLPYGDQAKLPEKITKRWNVTAAALPPANIKWLKDLVDDEILPPEYVVEVTTVGVEYGAQMASFAEVISDRLGFAAALADTAKYADLLQVAQAAVTNAEAAVRAVSGFARDLDKASGGSGDDVAEDPQANLYAHLDQVYRQWLQRITPGCDGLGLLSTWKEIVRRLAREEVDAMLQTVSPSAWTGRINSVTGRPVSVATALRTFEYQIRSALGDSPAHQDRRTETPSNQDRQEVAHD